MYILPIFGECTFICFQISVYLLLIESHVHTKNRKYVAALLKVGHSVYSLFVIFLIRNEKLNWFSFSKMIPNSGI